MCVPSVRAMTFITFFQGSVFVATWMAFPTAVCMFTGQTQTSYDSHAACSLSNTHQKKKKVQFQEFHCEATCISTTLTDTIVRYNTIVPPAA